MCAQHARREKHCGRPNILFIFSDQQHWQAAGYVDSSFSTPSMDRLAHEGVSFGNAFCTTPQCSPSRSSILTGLYPSKTGVLGNIGQAGGEPLRTSTIGTVLQKAGYRTAYFGKWHLGKDPVGTAGWDEDFGVTGPDESDDGEVTRRGIDFLHKNCNREQPFALFLSYVNPHDIYQIKREKPPVPIEASPLPVSWHKKDLAESPAVQRQFMTEDQGRFMHGQEFPAWQRYRELYREKVRLYDSELGRVLDALEKQGGFENTWITVTSDHGDMDGHHRLAFKGPFMYEQMMRVPLIIRPPGGEKNGKIVNFHTVNVDLPVTLAEIAGTSLPGTDGFSLLPFLTGNGTVPRRDFVIGEYYSKQLWVNPIRMIRTDQHKYNAYRFHGEELYDLVNDPMEITNLASDPRFGTAKESLAASLEQWICERQDPFHSLHPTTRDGLPL